MLCIRKRETVSYLQYVNDLDVVYQKAGKVSYLVYVYVLDFVHQKEGNCTIPTACLWSRLYVSERGKLYHTYNMLII